MLDHGHLRALVRQRVRDGVLLRLVGKWLKAGVMEEGSVRRSSTGTPQGGVISPLLANLYLLCWDYDRLRGIFPWNDPARVSG